MTDRTRWNSTFKATGKLLRRTTGLERSTPLPKVNRKRQAKRAAENEVYGEYHRYVSSLPCILYGRWGHECLPPVVGHHLKSVGSGGKDAANQVPCCIVAHDEIHRSAVRFEERWEVDLEIEADAIYREWLEAA